MELVRETVDNAGTSLNCYRAGDGPPMILLHGHPDCGYGWIRQIKHFAGDYSIIAPDLRGCGFSAKPDHVADYAMGNLVRDLAAIVDHYEFEDLTFVGHDWGGIIGWYYSAYHPDKIARFVTICAPHPAEYIRAFADPRQQRATSYMHRILTNGVFDVGLETYALRFPEKEVRSAFDEAMMETDFSAVAKYYQAARLESAMYPLAGIPKVTAPALVIYAKNDPAIIEPAYADTGRWTASGVDIVSLPLNTHFPHQERAGKVNTMISEWLDTL